MRQNHVEQVLAWAWIISLPDQFLNVADISPERTFGLHLEAGDALPPRWSPRRAWLTASWRCRPPGRYRPARCGRPALPGKSPPRGTGRRPGPAARRGGSARSRAGPRSASSRAARWMSASPVSLSASTASVLRMSTWARKRRASGQASKASLPSRTTRTQPWTSAAICDSFGRQGLGSRPGRPHRGTRDRAQRPALAISAT